LPARALFVDNYPIQTAQDDIANFYRLLSDADISNI